MTGPASSNQTWRKEKKVWTSLRLPSFLFLSSSFQIILIFLSFSFKSSFISTAMLLLFFSSVSLTVTFYNYLDSTTLYSYFPFLFFRTFYSSVFHSLHLLETSFFYGWACYAIASRWLRWIGSKSEERPCRRLHLFHSSTFSKSEMWRGF